MSTKRFFCLLILIFLTGRLADAGVITQKRDFNDIPNFTGSANFNQFDTLGGTRPLTSVKVEVALNIKNGWITLDNDSTSSASGNINFGVVFNLSSTTDVVLLNSAYQPILNQGKLYIYNTWMFNLGANSGDGSYDYDSNPPDGTVFMGSGQPISVSDFGFVNSTLWNQGAKHIIGTGNYNINYSISTWNDCTITSGIEYAISPVSTVGSITVTYTYDSVPEPTTITLLAAGFVFLKRKRKF